MTARFRSTVALACALGALLAATASATAAPPANDQLANAAPLTIGQTVNGTTTDAVDEGEQVSGLGWSFNNSVWYKYTPSTNGLFQLDVCADFGVNVVVMTGSSSPYSWASYGPNSFVQQYSTQSDCAGGSGTKYAAKVGPFPAVAGVELKVQVSSAYGGPSYTGPFTLTPSFTAAPANDDFANSQALLDDVLTTGTNRAATTEIGESVSGLGWSYNNSAWYSYTAASSGTLSVELCSQFGHNLITAFGSWGSLALPGDYPTPARQNYSDPQSCGYGIYSSVVSLAVTNGQTVRIHVGSAFSGINQQGDFAIRASLRSAPANDMFANATDLGEVASASQVGYNTAAELYGTSEPSISGNNRPKMVWYRWTAPTTGSATIDTCDTWGNLTIGVFNAATTTPALGDLQGIGGATDGCSAGHGAKVGIATEAGRRYWIAVASDSQYAYGEARFTLKIQLKPANDNWSEAIDLGSDDTVSINASSVNATADYNPETFEQLGPTIGAQPLRSSTVWFKWTAPRSDDFRFDACAGANNSYDGYMNVFSRGSESDPVPPYYNLLPRGTSDDDCGSLSNWPKMPAMTISATQGKVYWIGFAAATVNSDPGTNFTLRISSRPSNTELPTIDGDDSFVGTELTADPGAWAGTPTIGYEYEWNRCDVAGDNCSPIGSATQSTYTLVSADAGHRLKVRVTAGNFVGSASTYSALTETIDFDDDGDGVGDLGDNCPTAQTGTVKSNGCVPEEVEITSASYVDGDRSVNSVSGLTVHPGVSANSPGDDDSIDLPEVSQIAWYRCTSKTDTGQCDSRTASGQPDKYIVDEDDLGGYIRARLTWSGDDDQLDEWTAATPVYKISIGPRPSLSGTLQVGQTVTGNTGSAENQPETESGDAEPSVTSVYWNFCESQSVLSACTTGPATSSLVVPAEAQGKYLRFVVNWSNGITTRSEDSDASSQVAAAPVTPPAAPDPLNLAAFKFPKKASAKGLVKSKGKFTIKTIVFVCPAGGAECSFTYGYTAKVKKKTKKLGSSTQKIPAGSSQPLTGKLSSAGVKLIKSNKKLKVTIALKGSGGSAGKATFKEFTVTK